MKKAALLLASFILVFFTFSQESNFRLGIKVKPIISSIYKSKPDLNLESFSAISPSIIVDYKLTNNILISSGIEYEKKGGEGETLLFNDQGFSTGVSAYRFNLNFLQIPIYVTYRSNGKFKFYANLGCNLSYLIDQSLTHDDNSFPDSETNFNELELSFLMGAGIEISLTNQFDLGLGLRNNRAITDLESENGFLKLKTNTTGILTSINYNF